MIINDYMAIAKATNDCPACKSDRVGTNDKTGEWFGSINVNDNLYERKCKCGFEIVIDANNGTSKKVLAEQINQVLNKIGVIQSTFRTV